MKDRRTFFDEDAGRRLPTLIFEGCDGSGKSTAITRLTTDPREVMLFRQGEYRGLKGEIWRRNLACLLFDHGSDRARYRVLDRGWQSDAVYSPVYRKSPSRVPIARERMLERVALSSAAVAIYCVPSFAHCAKTFHARRGDEFLADEQQLREVWTAYKSAAPTGRRWFEQYTHRESGGLPAIEYDFTRDGQPENIIERAAECRELFGLVPAVRPGVAYWPAKWPGAGAFRPGKSILVVVEQDSPLGLPRVGDDLASTMMAEVLETIGVPELALYFVATMDVDGKDVSSELLADLRPRAAVVVGRSAELWLHDWKMLHGSTTPHFISGPNLEDFTDAVEEASRCAPTIN